MPVIRTLDIENTRYLISCIAKRLCALEHVLFEGLVLVRVSYTIPLVLDVNINTKHANELDDILVQM